MRVEILCTGNELLDGSVVDTNSAWFEARLFALGEEVAEKRVVPDDLGVIAAAMKEIATRADFCVVSGGLGPTPDDLTMEALALAAGVPLVDHAPTLERLAGWAKSRGRELTPNQARQARVPSGSQVITNEYGTAPHIQMKVGRCHFFLLPGVPREMMPLCDEQVLPVLQKHLETTGRTESYAFTQLRCTNIWEAEMAWVVRDLPKAFPGLRIGTRTTFPENHLKLRASGATPEEANRTLAMAVSAAREKLGTKVFTEGTRSFAQCTLDELRARRWTVALAESCTGGLCAALITEVAGASEVLLGSAVTYTLSAKSRLLGLDAAFIEREGAVSEAVTQAMATAVRKKLGADIGAAITGWAGPGGGTAKDPVGTFYAAIDGPAGSRVVRSEVPLVDRERVRRGAAFAALHLIRQAAIDGTAGRPKQD
jgi:nicotinamide-nucleotide amidase